MSHWVVKMLLSFSITTGDNNMPYFGVLSGIHLFENWPTELILTLTLFFFFKVGTSILFYFFFFSFIFISWRLITSQHCSGFGHTLTWISHGVTCIPHPGPHSHLPLHPIPLLPQSAMTGSFGDSNNQAHCNNYCFLLLPMGIPDKLETLDKLP